MREPCSEAPGLYVHVPFCLRKCRYCAFFSETNLQNASEWIQAVGDEASMVASRFAPFDTIYLGGGTPSVLTDEQLEDLLRRLRDRVDLSDDAEITVELNPGDVDEARATRWLALGISRASVGVQSFDDEALRFLGRRHDGKRAMAALKDLRAAGFRSLGIDLIWGLPTQTKKRVMSSLDQALAWSPEHLSCYELTIEEGTPLHRDVISGREKRLCEDEVVELAHAVWGRLSEAGYDHYEVSNFAKTREHRSRHNMKYWRHVPYLGLGPSAHSFDGARRRWANVSAVGAYCEAVAGGRRPTEFEEELTDDQLRSERIAMGMRTSEGVEAGLVDESVVISLEGEGLVRVEGGRVRPTEGGMLVADALALALARDGKAY